QFALQEATLVLGMLLKHFELIDHNNYQLKIRESLTLKPEDFTIKVRPRDGQSLFTFSTVNKEKEKKAEQTAVSAVDFHNTPLLVLYGSNMGTAEGIARELADTARHLGFSSKVAPLNDYVGKIPTEG